MDSHHALKHDEARSTPEHEERTLTVIPDPGLPLRLLIYGKPSLGLGDHEFRVLRLLSGTFADDIRCRVENYALESCPDYEALSYTWGASNYHRTIAVNDNWGFPVTDNLFSALRRLRRSHHTRTLWVDAICINQDDISERGLQVALMGEIYRSAAALLVWLGDDDRSTEVKAGLRLGEPNRPLTKIKSSFVDAVACTYPTWSTRAWVAQEIVQAPYPPKFCFGPYELSYVDLPRLAFSLAWSPADSLITAVDRFLTMKVHDIDLLHELDTRDLIHDFPKSQALDLYDVFLRTRGLDATDPRDHIYSLSSIAELTYTSVLQPDYSIGVAELYTRATYHMLDMTKSLHALACSPLDTNTSHNMPTWAVDFRNLEGIEDRLIAPPNRLSSKLVLSLNPGHVCSKAYVRFSADQNLLHVSGCELDEVTRVFTSEHKTWTLRSNELQAIMSLLEDLRPSSFCSPFFRKRNPRSFHPRVQDLSQQRRSLLELMSSIQSFWAHLNGFPLALWRDYGHAALPWLYFGFKSYGMSLFVTRQGLIGFGSPSIRNGDLLVLLSGSPGPSILHPRGSGFQFRGYPHVAGLEDLLHLRVKDSGYAFVNVKTLRYRYTEVNEVDGGDSFDFDRSYTESKLVKKRLEDLEAEDDQYTIPVSEQLSFQQKEFVLY